ncbi:amidohydrolase family protein [Mumia zhuanghuii]|uniref:Amidohydrolase family protein n=2 Tax=Mumia TaxID=1546255 RepID=A0ABW1QQD0_9ACTN|nr:MULTISPECIES: amidohydrolase family protein [Mumia]KAA1420468.1 amidohydrolase family protein [Mumia zhuanghuii]
MTVLLRGGTVIDGTGAPPQRADVLVAAGRIAAVGPALAAPVGCVVEDVQGREIVPGFVDTHAHDDLAILDDQGCVPKLRQGVTTVVVGNCGHGCAPTTPGSGLGEMFAPVLGGERTDLSFDSVRAYAETVAAAPRTVNAAVLAAHAALRVAAMGPEARAASAREVDAMCGQLHDAMEAGAAGLSLGLLYAPGNAAGRSELEELARVVAAHDGVLAAHVRNEGDHVLASIDEVVALGAETGCAIHLSHLKVTGPRNAGSMPRILDRLDAHRASGIDVTADVYPYAAGSTTTSTLLPSWALRDGMASVRRAVRDPGAHRRLAAELARPWEGAGLENTLLAIGPSNALLAGFSSSSSSAYEGRTLAEIAAAREQDPYACLVDLLAEEGGSLTAVLFHTDPEGVGQALSWPHSMVGSDGLPNRSGYVHPRLYGTFVRVLTEYAGASGPLSRAEAVHRMTGLSARRFGLRGRGTVEPGSVADLVVLDPVALEDRATFAEPRRHPGGVERVLVGGEVAWRLGQDVPESRGTYVPTLS